MIFGILGLLLLQTCHLPQLFRMWRRTRYGLRDVHPAFYITLFAGFVCYLIYSILIRDGLYITSNTVGILESGFALWLLYRARR